MFAAFVSPVQAARPLMTDDARIVAPKACQLETWVRRNTDGKEYWALPACNPGGNLEITFGGARTAADEGGTQTSDVLLQGKTLFKPLETNGWGIGLAAGVLSHPNEPRHRTVGEVYAYVPASFSFADDRVVLHANAGWLDRREPRQDRPTWGAGSEIRLVQTTGLVLELFDQAEGTRYQAGLRHWLVRDRMQVDFTYGNRVGGARESRWVSMGIRLLSPPFLP